MTNLGFLQVACPPPLQLQKSDEIKVWGHIFTNAHMETMHMYLSRTYRDKILDSPTSSVGISFTELADGTFALLYRSESLPEWNNSPYPLHSPCTPADSQPIFFFFFIICGQPTRIQNDSVNTNNVSFHFFQRDDFGVVSSILRQYLPEKDTPYILDVDLDFFSTRNPFKSLYERANLYESLASLYSFQRPETTDPEVSPFFLYNAVTVNRHAMKNRWNVYIYSTNVYVFRKIDNLDIDTRLKKKTLFRKSWVLTRRSL